MKKVMFTALMSAVLLTAASCSSARLTAEQKEEKAMKITEKIADKDFKINVSRAMPMRGRDVNLTSPYDLKIKGDSVYSHLPYFGRGYSIPYGGGEGMIFNGVMTNYNSKVSKRGVNTVGFKVRTAEDNYDFYLNIYPDGGADISVSPNNKSQISYRGQMDLSDKKK